MRAAIAAAVVMVLVVVGTVAVVAYRGYARQQAFERAQGLQTSAEQSYQNGDCASALSDVEGLTKIPQGDVDREKAASLQGLKSSVAKLTKTCETARSLEQGSGSPADQVSANSSFLATPELPAPLASQANSRISELIAKNGVAAIVNTKNCVDPTAFKANIAQTADLGELIFACAQDQEKSQDWAAAEKNYTTLLADYAGSPHAAAAATGQARAIVAQVKAGDSDDLSIPMLAQVSGPAGSATLTLYNNSTHSLRLTLSGSAGVVKTIPGCPECAGKSKDALCRGGGPSTTFQVPAGSYSVALETTDSSSIRPGLGNWALAAGTTYLDCYLTVGGSSGGSSGGPATGDA